MNSLLEYKPVGRVAFLLLVIRFVLYLYKDQGLVCSRCVENICVVLPNLPTRTQAPGTDCMALLVPAVHHACPLPLTTQDLS